MQKAVRHVSFTFLAASLLLMLAVPAIVIAQDRAPGSGLRVSPTRTELSVDAGKSKEIKQTVKNVTQSSITVKPVLSDFESDGTTGEPILIGDPDKRSVYTLREFITLPDPFDLNPDEEKEITLNVNVPENAAPGGYFGSVLYRATPQGSSGDGQVALVASVGSLVLLEVPGDIVEQIEIKSISAYIGKDAGSFFTRKPDGVGLNIENKGNSFSQPFGKVSVKDWRGNEVFQYDMNGVSPKSNILPKSSRLFLDELMNVEKKTVNGKDETEKTNAISTPGRYTITGNISHNSTGEVYTVSTTFWYIPMWIVIALAVIVVALVGGGYYLFRKYSTRSTKR